MDRREQACSTAALSSVSLCSVTTNSESSAVLSSPCVMSDSVSWSKLFSHSKYFLAYLLAIMNAKGFRATVSENIVGEPVAIPLILLPEDRQDGSTFSPTRLAQQPNLQHT